jgi:hypothetical protein
VGVIIELLWLAWWRVGGKVVVVSCSWAVQLVEVDLLELLQLRHRRYLRVGKLRFICVDCALHQRYVRLEKIVTLFELINLPTLALP